MTFLATELLNKLLVSLLLLVIMVYLALEALVLLFKGNNLILKVYYRIF